MKKIALTLTLVVLGAFALAYFYLSKQPNPEFTTISPNKTYRIYMQDSELESFNHVVRFNVAKNERPLIDNEIFYSGSNQYLGAEPKYTWVSENVLRFGGLDSVPAILPDEIFVENQTDRVVRYLKVTAGNDFLILEVQPQTKTRLFASPQTDKMSSLSWVGGYIKFDGDRDLTQWGRNFTVEGKYIAPAHYCVIIKREGVVVQSREFDSAKGVEPGKIAETSVPKNAFCQ